MVNLWDLSMAYMHTHTTITHTLIHTYTTIMVNLWNLSMALHTGIHTHIHYNNAKMDMIIILF